ncbi:hypothetical protein [Bradyrhizobium betae]|uniref:Uncharacterized protein n=1 Tax=Bradyrhizobium betae TaxID=244734 RepID=A0A5P6NYW3_9BRAD|nr:hypothetical protein [Bradyrhizobium betae]MCS3725469.1 hypothetical protein [Bradyrhizobium betae]QFI71240.1 hypothetical protein F8237_01930 [Bradyrhizobium betae]
MTRDLYDIAKPVRDAALAEIMRCFEADTKADGVPVSPAILEGHKLGTHMQALCVAHCAERYKSFTSGFVIDDPIVDIYAVALAQVGAHMAATARPTTGGRPVSPTVSGQAFIKKVAQLFFQQLVHMEHGLLDFNIPFQRSDDGSIAVETFDLAAMLNKGRGE